MVVMVADMVRAVAQVAQAVVAVRVNGQAKIAASHDEWLAFFCLPIAVWAEAFIPA
ncbi:hypothetical protein LRQ11_28350 [Pseudomonas sp. MAFF 311095]|uniref:hypothetical protein n=1 Tax=Pseudomonas petroselini TaxID=2899822 RepID=UPI0020B22591|nr:hypothetical protein [Pseudomonas petroselini]MCD7082481.1 hypothetical protein [Pseudomonas petroselini]